MMCPCANSVLRELKDREQISVILEGARLCGMDVLPDSILGDAQQWEFLKTYVEGMK